MSATKTKNRKKTKAKQQPKMTRGPLVIVQAPSAYEILSLLRDSIEITLGEMTLNPAQRIPTTGVPASRQLVNNWDQLHEQHRQVEQQRERPHKYLPAAAVGAPLQKTWRARVVEWITDYVGPREAGRTDEDYRQAYKGAYRQLMLRYGVDVEQRSRNAARKIQPPGSTEIPAGMEPIDFVERLGLMEELFKIVCEIYPMHEVDPSLRSEPVLAGPRC